LLPVIPSLLPTFFNGIFSPGRLKGFRQRSLFVKAKRPQLAARYRKAIDFTKDYLTLGGRRKKNCDHREMAVFYQVGVQCRKTSPPGRVTAQRPLPGRKATVRPSVIRSQG